MKRLAWILALAMVMGGMGSALADEAVQPDATQAADAATDAAYSQMVRGDKGEGVQALMQRLADLGYYKSSVDDSFGPGMAKAVMLFNAQHGIAGGETATVQTQSVAFSDAAQAYTVMPPVIKTVTLEEYDGTPVFSVDVYNPQESAINFISVIYRCYDSDGNAIYATGSDAAAIGAEPMFGKYRDISIECGAEQNLRTVTSFDLSAYPGVARVDAALYCYSAGSTTMIIPETYFAWVSSDGSAAVSTVSEAGIAAFNRTAEQDSLATSFVLGAETEYVFAFESEHYNLPCGYYVKSVEDGGYCAQAGIQAGDVITSLAGVSLDFEEALYMIKAQMQTGTEYEIGYSRAGQQLTGNITVAAAGAE